VNEIAGYVKKENFIRAFEIYVDKANPALSDWAKEIGDLSHNCCRSILNRCQETVGWLWKQADISREIDDTLCEYEIISLVKPPAVTATLCRIRVHLTHSISPSQIRTICQNN
jgi:hypothetical protein